MANHLWQSTVFAGAVALLTLAFRRNRASVRFWLWFAASVKFLIPFAVLVEAGKQLAWPAATLLTPSALTQVAGALSEPFASQMFAVTFFSSTLSPSAPVSLSFGLTAMWAAGALYVSGRWWRHWLYVAAIARDATEIKTGRELTILRALEKRLTFKRPITLILSSGTLEPGVFGVLKPVMLWPRHLTGRLDDVQVEAIVAHEVCHVHRRDNLLAAVHMFVEATFWFHPLVWWIGSRLIDERERACDEDVIALGSAPHVYAESILKTCELCVELPTACASGVTGSDLKRRIVRIARGRLSEQLGVSRKVMLALAATLVLVVPVGVGIGLAPNLHAQIPVLDANGPRFEVASVKPNTSLGGPTMMQVLPGRMNLTNVTLRIMLRNAYRIQEFQMSGGPSWLETEHFDVVAKAEGNPTMDELAGMLRGLLADRFKLSVHRESRDMPIYALVTTPSTSAKLRRSDLDCFGHSDAPPEAPGQGNARCGFRMSAGTMSATGASLSALASSLSMRLGRGVVDRTNLSGGFDFDLNWTPDQRSSGGPEAAAVDPNGPSIFTAIQEQLGLKLEPARGPVETLVIDHVERPTAD